MRRAFAQPGAVDRGRLGLQGAALFANIEIFGLHTNRHGSSPGDGWEKGHLVAG